MRGRKCHKGRRGGGRLIYRPVFQNVYVKIYTLSHRVYESGILFFPILRWEKMFYAAAIMLHKN
jgi:hypothetical protein